MARPPGPLLSSYELISTTDWPAAQVRASVVNDALVNAGSTLRLVHLSSRRIYMDIPWGNMTSREAKWTLQVEELNNK